MTLTPELEKELMVHYNRTQSPFKAAKAVGISAAEAWAAIDKHKELGNFEERHKGLGRPEMQHYAVATRRAAESGWDNSLPEIAEARRRYEAGTHDMATGRDGRMLILYSLPRRGRVPRPNYFTPEKM